MKCQADGFVAQSWPATCVVDGINFAEVRHVRVFDPLTTLTVP
jgi:hypothetical protein